jgi:hypothetical protein
MPQIDLSILNQRQTPAFYADVLANRPAAGFIGRIFVSTNTFEFYRDNGTGWDLIGGPGAGTITGSGAAGQVTYWNGASSVTGDNGLFYDSANDRLGIGTTTPGAAIDAHSTQSTILQLNQTAINDTRIAFQLSGSALWRLGNFYNGGANDFELFDVIGAQASITVKKTSGQVLIGTSTVGSGKLVVASATSDNGIQIVGANAPSLRIDNAESGPTKRAGFGISTATNNFIQGSADRDFCIFNGSTTASPMLFGIYDTTNVQEAARISAARNFIIGSSVDAGYKLDVNGTGRFTGALNTTGGTRQLQMVSFAGDINYLKSTGANFQTGTSDANSYFIQTNNVDRLTISSTGITTLSGTNQEVLGITGNSASGTVLRLSNTTTGGGDFRIFSSGSGNGEGAGKLLLTFNGAVPILTIGGSTGNLLIGSTTDDGNKLQVNGSGVFSGDIKGTVDLYLLRSGVAPAIVLSQQQVRFVDQSTGFSQSININSDNLQFSGGIRTAAPSGGSQQTWKLGNYTAGAAVQGGKVRVEINGVAYDLLTA